MSDLDTIFALATPPGRAALAIVRVSGAEVPEVVKRHIKGPLPSPRLASLCNIFDINTGDLIDQAVVTYYAAPKSFTGEDCVEFTLHGGSGVSNALLRSLRAIPGLRIAGPGEFSRRAFALGKIDLTQAEAIADLIDSETEFQRRQALRIVQGSLREKVNSWRDGLLSLAAGLESQLDFSDEGDVSSLELQPLLTIQKKLVDEISWEIETSAQSLALKDGFTVVIAGEPNSGKSTLFNYLVKSDAAIVSNIPGTTRDLISARLDINGLPITFVDCAGIRETTDEIELLGIDRALGAANSANLVLWLRASNHALLPPKSIETPILSIFTKHDLGYIHDLSNDLVISTHTNFGLTDLIDRIAGIARNCVSDGSSGSLIRIRHKQALEKTLAELILFKNNILNDQYELASEDIRSALEAIAKISGVISSDAVLDLIFSQFCIGK